MATNGSAPVQNGSGKDKPLLFFTTVPADGHLNPPLMLASHMVKQGYDVVFQTSPTFKAKVEATGAETVPVDDIITPESFARLIELGQMPFGIERFTEEFLFIFVAKMASKAKQIDEALVNVRARYPDRQIILVEDIPNWGMYPYKHGRPLPAGWTELPKSIGVGVSPLLIDSVDTAPIMLGLPPPEPTPEGREKNAARLKEFREGPLKHLLDSWAEGMEKAGATDMSGPKKSGIFNSWYNVHDAVVQLCSPSMEYKRSDQPSTINFIGVLQGSPPKADLEYPSWWSDVSEAKKNGKSVVFVTQGTTNPDLSELIMPTISALAGRDDIITVAALGMRGASLPEGFKVPDNARVIDYFPYDVVLEHTDVFVSNAGYGSFGHAVRNAIPMVLAGQAQEKYEVALRVEWAGMGVDLKTQRPTEEQVKGGVDKILAEPSFKKAAIGLKEENEKLDAYAAFERKVEELTV